jgi:hypothetical protein
MTGCERCGRLDSSLRASGFIYTISLLLVTFKRGAGGVYCGSCRKKAGFKYTFISAIFGWWGIPWGPVYTLQAIGRNSAGGYQDRDLNAELLQGVAAELIERGDKSGAVAALEESLRLREDGSVRQALWSLAGEGAGGYELAPVSEPICTGSERKPHAPVKTVPVEDPLDPTFRCPICGREQRVAAEIATGPATVPSPLAAGSFRPGELVRSVAGGVQMFSQPGTTGEPVALLGSESAVVTRSQPGWVELQVPGGKSGWVPESVVQSE